MLGLPGPVPRVTAQNGRERDRSDADARVDALIAQMTPAERIAQLGDRAPAIPRLHVPAYNWWSEGLHGVARDGYATVFPQAIGLAATWDAPLLLQTGEAVANEARQHFARFHGGESLRYAGLTIWSPNVNLFRDPRWGRGQETYGEDPYLTGWLGSSFVRGIQGSDHFYLRAVATPKHFAVHSGPETGRDSFNSVVSPHDLNDSYYQAFRTIVTEAHPASLMCSYNAINGVPSCASEANLTKLVRGTWGFNGYVVSDCDAVGNISSYQHYAPDLAHGAANALRAGVDLDCGRSYNALAESTAQKLVSQNEIKVALHRLLLARMRLGLLGNANCSPYALDAVKSDTAEHHKLALRAAVESAVLLKNDGLLPLSPKTKLAVVGPTADMLRVLEANYHGTALHPVTLLDGLSRAFSRVSYAQGSALVDGVSLPVPRTALFNNVSPEAQQGLRAEYFAQPSLSGEPAERTVVPTVELDLNRAGPTPRITSKQFAARWTGALRTPGPGNYLLRVHVERCWDCSAHDTDRLYLDGKLVVDNTGARTESDHFTLHDSKPTAHSLRLELLHTGDDEGISLEWSPEPEPLIAEAVQVAGKADVVVAAVGLSPDLEGEALSIQVAGFAGGDRTTLALPKAQAHLLQCLQELGKPIVLAITSGSAIALSAPQQQANAIFELWYPGESGGTAFADLLTGAANPSGRLPVTFYKSEADLPAFTDYSMAARTYRYFAGPVLYPFGYGLSYSTFRYERPRASTKVVTPGSEITLSSTVRNQGSSTLR